jgi:hypothetical protein
VLTVADPCIWHGCGTNLSRRQPATTPGAPTDQARVCLAAPPPSSATLSGCVVDQSKRRRPSRDEGRDLQLGKLRAPRGGLGAELGERLNRGLVELGCFPRDSPLFPLNLARLWCGWSAGNRGRPKLVCGGVTVVGTLGS